MNNIVETVAGNIKRARKKRKLSQAEFGQQITGRKNAQNYVSRLEDGSHEPTISRLAEIANATGLRIQWFLEPH